MKKYEIDYLRQRIGNVVKCSNGTVSTKLQGVKKKTGLTNKIKYELIKSGKATLRSMFELTDEDSRSYRDKLMVCLIQCYTYPMTPEQKKAVAFNKTIDAKIEDIHTEIFLEGERILDKALLNIITAEEIPDELNRLGNMVALAN